MSNHDDDLPVDEPVNSEQPSKLRQKLAERKAQREAQEREAAEATSSTSHEEDLVPEIQYERTDEDKEVDEILENIDIVDAYKHWCGKMVPKVGNKREGIMISCPIPGHIDERPSAWINLDKQTWFCGGCDEGGDAYDIAAYRLGYPVPDYKNGAQFHKLRRDMAAEFGLVIVEQPGSKDRVLKPVDESESEKKEATSQEDSSDNVVDLYESYDKILFPGLEWREIVSEGTFLHTYLNEVTRDDAPEEYHFWHGLLALGFSLGRDVTLADGTNPPVLGNLFICTIGESGIGKSKAQRHLTNLLRSALPHNSDDPNSKGTRVLPSPSSAEVLISLFLKPIYDDPVDPKKVTGYAPIRGLIPFSELSTLMGRNERKGSVMVPTLQQFADGEDVVTSAAISSGIKEVPDAFASSLTTTQPGSLKNLLDEKHAVSGFLNRWIFAGGIEKKQFSIGKTRIDLDESIRKLEEIYGWAGSFGPGEMVEWSDEGAEIWDKFFHQKVEPRRKTSESDLFVRLALQLKKLMLLFAANEMKRFITPDIVIKMTKCFDYLVECYSLTGEQIGNSEEYEMREAILGIIKKYSGNDGRGVSKSQIARSLKRRKYSDVQLDKVLNALTSLELIYTVKPPPGQVGRSTVRYKYAG